MFLSVLYAISACLLDRLLRRAGLERASAVERLALRHVLHGYIDHYNTPRPHRALRLQAPVHAPQPAAPPAAVVRCDKLGGLLHEYAAAAA